MMSKIKEKRMGVISGNHVPYNMKIPRLLDLSR